MKKLLTLMTIGGLLLLVAGCGGRVDPGNPEQVAEAVWRAIIEGDMERFKSYVIPRDREAFNPEEFAKELERLPPLPDKPQVRLVFEGDEAEALLENWDFDQGLEMILEDGRWWIQK